MPPFGPAVAREPAAGGSERREDSAGGPEGPPLRTGQGPPEGGPHVDPTG